MTSWWYTYWDNCNSKCRSVCPEVIFVHFPLSSGNPSSFFCFCFPWLPHFCLLSLSSSFLFSVPFPYFVLFLRFWNSFNFICFFLLLALPFRFYFFFFLHGHLHPPFFLLTFFTVCPTLVPSTPFSVSHPSCHPLSSCHWWFVLYLWSLTSIRTLQLPD